MIKWLTRVSTWAILNSASLIWDRSQSTTRSLREYCLISMYLRTSALSFNGVAVVKPQLLLVGLSDVSIEIVTFGDSKFVLQYILNRQKIFLCQTQPSVKVSNLHETQKTSLALSPAHSFRAVRKEKGLLQQIPVVTRVERLKITS